MTEDEFKKQPLLDGEPIDPFDLAFIFRDVSLTVPANRKLWLWLHWMVENHKDDLKWLHLESQAYVKYGGGSGYTFDLWITRLNKSLKLSKAELFNG